MKFKLKNRPITGFPIISLADIVLLLLIYFLLTSTYILSQGIKVKLPEAIAEKITEPKMITITITERGTIYFENNIISLDELPLKVREFVLKRGEEAPIVILADKDVKIQNAVKVMEGIRNGGGKKIIIATREP